MSEQGQPTDTAALKEIMSILDSAGVPTDSRNPIADLLNAAARTLRERDNSPEQEVNK